MFPDPLEGRGNKKLLESKLSEQKNRSEYRVHGILIDQLGLTVSTQISVLKNMYRVPRYWPKCVKFCWFGLVDQFLTLFW